MTSVRAWQVDNFGDFRQMQLRQIPRPDLPAGRVRIRVEAIGMNFPDVLMAAGRYQLRPEPPFTPGFECAGEVIEVADDVAALAPGNRVLAGIWWGAYASEVVAPARRVFAIPPDMPAAHAAGFYASYLTAGHGLISRAGLRPGETVVVTGATGALGSSVIQTARALGADVIAVVGSETKLPTALANGANSAIVAGTLRSSLREMAPDGVGVVFDVVGGDLAGPLTRHLGWGGRYLAVGFASGSIAALPTNLLLLNGSALVGVNAGAAVELEPGAFRHMFDQMIGMYRQGLLSPIVTRYPMEQAVTALQEIVERRAIGKYVLEP